jgi:hypothetical protein
MFAKNQHFHCSWIQISTKDEPGNFSPRTLTSTSTRAAGKLIPSLSTYVQGLGVNRLRDLHSGADLISESPIAVSRNCGRVEESDVRVHLLSKNGIIT